MKKKLKIEQLKLESFVTSVRVSAPQTIKGGNEVEVSVREAFGGCWVSEPTGPSLKMPPIPKLKTGALTCDAWTNPIN